MLVEMDDRVEIDEIVKANPEIAGQDPFVTRDQEGNFYLIEVNGSSIQVKRSQNLVGIFSPDVETIQIFTAQEKTRNEQVWAPEMHQIGDKWYVYYSASDGKNENHRMYVLEGDSPTGPFEDKGQIYDSEYNNWAIDGTVLKMPNGDLYFVWSGWALDEVGDPRFTIINGIKPNQYFDQISDRDQRQHLFIAKMDTPYSLVPGSTHIISTPEPLTEGCINEGPQQVMREDNNIQIIYSANPSWSDEYCQFTLNLRPGADPLIRESWVKSPTHILEPNVGHPTIVSEKDKKYLVFHKKRDLANLGWNDRAITIREIEQEGDKLKFKN